MRSVQMFADDRAVFAANRQGNFPNALSAGISAEMRGCPGFLDRREWTDTTQHRTAYPVRFKRLGNVTFTTRH